jgi:hypothetical protein
MPYIKKVTEKRTKSKYRDVVVTADLDVPCNIVLARDAPWNSLIDAVHFMENQINAN